MAHFVDGIRFRRISDQLVHVPLRRTTLVGLWRGFEPGGVPLEVSVAAGGPLQLSERATRGEFRMFALQGVRVADVQLVALDSRGRVVDRVDVHIHMPRTRQLPPFDKLLSHYAGDDESSEDCRQRIGGQVDNPQLANTCTLRISEAFNYAGQPIPGRRPGHGR